MATREEIVALIQEWVSLDTRAKELAKQGRECRGRRKQMTERLVRVMKENGIDCFNMSSGQLIYTRSKSRAPVSKKHLMETLSQYFAGVPQVNSAEVAQFVLDQRATKTQESLRHKVAGAPQTNLDPPLSND